MASLYNQLYPRSLNHETSFVIPLRLPNLAPGSGKALLQESR